MLGFLYYAILILFYFRGRKIFEVFYSESYPKIENILFFLIQMFFVFVSGYFYKYLQYYIEYNSQYPCLKLNIKGKTSNFSLLIMMLYIYIVCVTLKNFVLYLNCLKFLLRKGARLGQVCFD